MRKTDDEVLRYLRSDPSTALEIDFPTFASYAHEKSQWLDDFTLQHGREPSPSEQEVWISNWTDLQFGRLRLHAAEFFDIAARTYMQQDIEDARNAARQEIIVREVKAAGSWWRQLAIALVSAILTPVILALIVFAASHTSDIENTLHLH